MATRLGLPYLVLSDAGLALTEALRLPTFRYGEWTLLRRLSLIIRGGRIEHVIYPVFPSNADAPAAVAWLRTQVGAARNGAGSGGWTRQAACRGAGPLLRAR